MTTNDNLPSNPKTEVNQSEIAEKIKAILGELLEIDPATIESSTKLEDDLGADSLLYLELFEELKDELNLDLDLHDIGKYATRHPVSTVGEVTELVTRYLEKGDEMLKEMEKEAVDPV
jgi:acyl carrier protein